MASRNIGYGWAIAAGLNAAGAAISAKLFSYQLIKYGLVILFNVTMWGCYVNSLKALPSLEATVTNFATNFLSSGLAGFFLFEEPLPSRIHSKRRNRLEHKRLNDLVYVHYNQILHHRYQKRDSIDPISLKDIDDSNEWLTGQMDSLDLDEGGDGTAAPYLVFSGEDLDWAIVNEAAGVDEPQARTRAKGKAPASTSNVYQRRGRARLAQVDEEEDVDEDEEEEEEFVCDDDSDDYPEDETYDIDMIDSE